MTLGQRLREAREKQGWSQTYVAKKIGISSAVISNYERDYRTPDAATLSLLATVYEETVDYLISGNKRNEGGQISLWQGFESLKQFLDDPELSVEGTLEANLPSGVNQSINIVLVPLFNQVFEDWREIPKDNILGYYPVPKTEVGAGQFFFLLVPDDSMSGDGIYSGDKVLVRRGEIRDASIAIVRSPESPLTLRRVHFHSDVVGCESTNPNYPFRFYGRSSVTFFGEVQSVIRQFS